MMSVCKSISELILSPTPIKRIIKLNNSFLNNSAIISFITNLYERRRFIGSEKNHSFILKYFKGGDYWKN